MIYQYEYNKATKGKGKEIGKYNNIKELMHIFPNKKKHNIISGIYKCSRGSRLTAFGYVWEEDGFKIQKRYGKEYMKIDDIVTSELRAMRALVRKGMRNYEAYVFNDEQAEKLSKEIREKFHFKVDYYPCSLEPLIFKVECRR